MSNRPSNTIYGADILDGIARLWAAGTITAEIARVLKIPHGSVCRLARVARTKGDLRFPARATQPIKKPRVEAPSSPKAERPRSKPARLKPRPVSAEPSPKVEAFLYPRIYELKQNACRYPTGEREGEQRFCAKPQCARSSYCDEHDRLCNTSVRQAAGKPAGFALSPMSAR